jgi:hypothetical protein
MSRVLQIFARSDVAKQRDITFGNAGAGSILERGSTKVVIDVEQNVERSAALAINDGGDGGTGESELGPDKIKQVEGGGHETGPVTGVKIPKARPAGETGAYSLREVQAMIAVLPEPAATVVAVAGFAGWSGLTIPVTHCA